MEQEHYEFLEYAQQAGVSEMLKGETKENFTVFVPSIECFQSMLFWIISSIVFHCVYSWIEYHKF